MEQDSNEVFLPKQSTLENTDMRKMKWLIYGPAGIGKSTFVSQSNGVLFLSTDGGMRFIESMNRPIDSWVTFKKYVKAIQAERPNQYKSICIDVADHLVTMCQKYICDKRGIEHQSDEPYGKAYDLITREFSSEILKLVGLGKYGLFFISHAKDVERKTRLSTLTKTEPTLKNPGWSILQPMMDIIAYFAFDPSVGEEGEIGRRMYFQPTENMEAKDRTKVLPESLYIPHPEEVNGFELVEQHLVEGRKNGKPTTKTKAQKKKIILKRR
jgi:hypothetical protein